MSDYDDDDYIYPPEIQEVGDALGFGDDPTAMDLYYEGFLTSSNPEHPWYDPDYDANDRWEARREFEEHIEEYYEDFDWEEFWDLWYELYGKD